MVHELNLVFDTEFVRSKQLGKRHQHLGFTQTWGFYTIFLQSKRAGFYRSNVIISVKSATALI